MSVFIATYQANQIACSSCLTLQMHMLLVGTSNSNAGISLAPIIDTTSLLRFDLRKVQGRTTSTILIFPSSSHNSDETLQTQGHGFCYLPFITLVPIAPHGDSICESTSRREQFPIIRFDIFGPIRGFLIRDCPSGIGRREKRSQTLNHPR